MIWCIKTYIIAYVKTQKIKFITHYVKPTAQLFFKIRFPKGGPIVAKICDAQPMMPYGNKFGNLSFIQLYTF